MPDTTPNLDLPFLLPAQAQKHVTHNEALERLDLIVQLTLQRFDAESPPAAPPEGRIWALGPAPGGDWAGQAGKLATFLGGAWTFLDPREGWRAWGLAEAQLRVWRGTAWEQPPLDDLPGVGIGTTHDGTNRLAVVSPATLFSHAGAGHQVKVNKAAAGDTASLLFQDGWSGRAEMGLAGSDDFSVKVSADGGAWTEALRIARASGAAEMAAGLKIGGQLAFHRGNAVGTVAQVAGLPTGALVESGSTANGRYIRHADGTQICWKEAVMGQSVAAGSYAELTWVYPMPFAAGSVPYPMVVARSYNDAAGRQNAARYLRAVGGGGSASAGAVGVFNGHTAAVYANLDALVIGRWT